MIRVLQLFDRATGFQSERGANSLARDLGPEFVCDVRSIGRRGTYSGSVAALAALRKGGSRAAFDLIHAWGIRALTVAALASRNRLIFTPDDAPRRRSIRWLRAVMNYRDIQVICPTSTWRRALVSHGIPIDRCHLIRPGVDFARVRRRRSPELRSALGYGPADRVVLFAGESIRAAGHREGVWATSILHVLESKYKALLWGRGDRAEAHARFARRLGSPKLLVLAEQHLGRAVEFEELLPAADLVLVPASGAVATLPISICMAAALPLVATVSSTVSELLEDRHTALIAPQGSPRALARRILDIEEDATLQWNLADMARTEAYEYFSLSRFVNQHREAYRGASAGKVEISEAAPGAGSRFHGLQ